MKARRATRVVRGFPRWLFPLVIKAYALERELQGLHFLVVRGLVENFLIGNTVSPNCPRKVGFVDHCGHDAQGNFICEPYARHCSECRADAAEFAAKLGLHYEESDTTYYLPGNPQLLRLTFFAPPGSKR